MSTCSLHNHDILYATITYREFVCGINVLSETTKMEIETGMENGNPDKVIKTL